MQLPDPSAFISDSCFHWLSDGTTEGLTGDPGGPSLTSPAEGTPELGPTPTRRRRSSWAAVCVISGNWRRQIVRRARRHAAMTDIAGNTSA